MARLTEISQTVTALTTTRFSASAIAARAVSASRLSTPARHMKACVSSSRSTSGIVAKQLQQLGRQWRIEIVGHIGKPEVVHLLSRGFFLNWNGDKLRHRFAVLGNDNLFAGGSTIHQRRQLVFRLGELEDLGHESGLIGQILR